MDIFGVIYRCAWYNCQLLIVNKFLVYKLFVNFWGWIWVFIIVFIWSMIRTPISCWGAIVTSRMYSLVGMSIEGVKICTWHELGTLQLSENCSLRLYPPHTISYMYISEAHLMYIFRCRVQFATCGPWNNSTYVIIRSLKREEETMD